MNAPDRIDSYVLADGEKKMVYANDEKIPNAGTFTIAKETHTVGNLLQMQVLRNNQVRYCGYKMPHPLQNTMLVKVQTTTSKATPVAVVGAARGAPERVRCSTGPSATPSPRSDALAREERERAAARRAQGPAMY
ncbi:RNA polymerase II [Aureococcus anophagefferens]|nr:RNA polymerase II [Aureococcus anophagefferens]